MQFELYFSDYYDKEEVKSLACRSSKSKVKITTKDHKDKGQCQKRRSEVNDTKVMVKVEGHRSSTKSYFPHITVIMTK